MPRPAHFGRKVRKVIVTEACLDVTSLAEGFWDCTKPRQLIDQQRRIADHIKFVRELDSGQLSDYWAVDRAQKLIENEQQLVKQSIGETEIYLADEGGDGPKAVQRRSDIARLVKRGLRLRKGLGECRRWRSEYFEEERDRQAAERVAGSPCGR